MREQKRWKCSTCKREWINKIYASEPGPSLGPGDNCPICGSADTVLVRFKGLFDIDTPANVMEAILASVTELPLPVGNEKEVAAPAKSPLTLVPAVKHAPEPELPSLASGMMGG